jgi:hypothetical protein
MGLAPCDPGPLSQRSLATSWLGQWSLVSVRKTMYCISKGEKSSYNPVISDYVARISFRKGCLKDSITFEEIVVVLLDRNTNKAVEISAM